MSRVLVVGATGMLAPVARHLATSASELTFTGHRQQRVAQLQQSLAKDAAQVRGLALDWTDAANFLQAFAHLPPQDLVVAWLHQGSLGPGLARALHQPGHPMRFIQVLGSAAARPGADADRLRRDLADLQDVQVQHVVLGFQIEGAASRWLTDTEISNGVLEAINSGHADTIVGTVTPWHRRP